MQYPDLNHDTKPVDVQTCVDVQTWFEIARQTCLRGNYTLISMLTSTLLTLKINISIIPPMVESLRETRITSVKESLKMELNKARRVGFITYCLVAGKDVPSEIETNFKRFFGGELNLEGLKRDLNEGRLCIGVEMTESCIEQDTKTPILVLMQYGQFLENYSLNLDKAKKPLKGQPMAIGKFYPQLQQDTLFSEYWPDLFPMIRDDKAFWQYLITHLRATIFGFAQAANQFGDNDVHTKATELVRKFNDKNRIDALELAGMRS